MNVWIVGVVYVAVFAACCAVLVHVGGWWALVGALIGGALGAGLFGGLVLLLLR